MNRVLLATSFLFLTLTISCTSLEGKKPSLSANEYWSELVANSRSTQTPILVLLKQENPHLYKQIEQDSKDLELTSFWGKSYNFDSGAKKQIIDEAIIGDLQGLFQIKNDNLIVHAGITHTYGYLFSVLNTPYGFKRKRWIDPTLNLAFSFSGKSLSPETLEGGLLSNITYFAGTIAFKLPKDREALKSLKNVSTEVKHFDFSKLSIVTLEEEINQAGTSVQTLRTTLVKLPFKRADEENDYLLIYSILDSLLQKEVLITEKLFLE